MIGEYRSVSETGEPNGQSIGLWDLGLNNFFPLGIEPAMKKAIFSNSRVVLDKNRPAKLSIFAKISAG